MKRREEVVIYINVNVEGEEKTLCFDPKILRNWIDNMKVSEEGKIVGVEVNSYNKISVEKNILKEKLDVIRKALKYADLLDDIIPKNLNKYLEDFTQKLASRNLVPMVGRKYEIEKIWFYLSQTNRNNVFIIGEKDVGKTRTAMEIARKIATNECPKEFYDKRVILFKPEQILSIEREYTFKRKVKMIINFLYEHQNEIILYIDNAIMMLMDYELLNILYICIKRMNIPLIVTVSEEYFEKYFYNDDNIAKYINYTYLNEPEYEEVQEMIRHHIKKLKSKYKINISEEMVKFAIYTSSLTDSISVNPGNVINIFNRSFLEAKRKGKDEVDKKCILECYPIYVKDYVQKPLSEKISTAYHETGHYMLATMTENLRDTKISCVSILPMTWWEGVTMSYKDPKEYSVHSREYYLDYIAFLLAGRIAERKFTGMNSTGAMSDLERANAIAKAMIMKWGLSSNKCNLNRSYDEQYDYLMSETKKEAIDNEIEKIISEANQRAKNIIEENAELLKIIAEKLVEDEVITGENLEKICKKYFEEKR